MRIESLFIKGSEKEIREILEEVKKRLGKGKIWTVEINQSYEEEDFDEL